MKAACGLGREAHTVHTVTGILENHGIEAVVEIDGMKLVSRLVRPEYNLIIVKDFAIAERYGTRIDGAYFFKALAGAPFTDEELRALGRAGYMLEEENFRTHFFNNDRYLLREAVENVKRARKIYIRSEQGVLGSRQEHRKQQLYDAHLPADELHGLDIILDAFFPRCR